MGIGATYRWATLNLAYGFGFLNPDRGRGKTKYLDLQFHGYGRKFSIDVLGQFYNGFYLTPRGTGTTHGTYYQRPDIEVGAVGASAQYIFNYRKFSYRAAFLQNEWQKRTAGTFLLGQSGLSAEQKVTAPSCRQKLKVLRKTVALRECHSSKPDPMRDMHTRMFIDNIGLRREQLL